MTQEELDHYNKLWDYYNKDLEQYQFDFDRTRSPMYGGRWADWLGLNIAHDSLEDASND
tara:strand:+ start:824 stop:1000 length:177 start_codon:yes stop_codon:yes gene_type:complete